MADKNEEVKGKIPPQNLDAEKSLLGAVLIDEEVLADAAEITHPSDFYDKNHGLIFAGMMRLFEKHKPVDLLTLTDELKRYQWCELSNITQFFENWECFKNYRRKYKI